MKRRLVLDEPEAERPEPEPEDDRESHRRQLFPRRKQTHRRLSGQPGRQRYFTYHPPQSREEKERRNLIRGSYTYNKHPEIARDTEDKLRREDMKRSRPSSVRRSTSALATDIPSGSTRPAMGPPRSQGSVCHSSNKLIKEEFTNFQEDLTISQSSLPSRGSRSFIQLGPTAAYETNLIGSPRPPTQTAAYPFSSSLVIGPHSQGRASHTANKIIKEDFTNFQEGQTSTRSSKLPSGGSRSFVQLGRAASDERTQRPATQMSNDRPYTSGPVMGPGGVFKWPPRN